MIDKTPHDRFYDGEEFLRSEHQLFDLCYDLRDAFENHNARRHFVEGFSRRLDMIQFSRLHLMRNTSPERTEVSSPYAANESAIHLNAFYLNIRGGLDNLAWTLKWELDLFPPVVEDQFRGRSNVDLFKPIFQNAVSEVDAELTGHVAGFSEWAEQLRQLRDPAAHRIPIYVPPGVIESEEKLEEYRRIEAQAALPRSELGGRSRAEILMEAASVARPTCMAVLSVEGRLIPFGIGGQVGSDHREFLGLSLGIVKWMEQRQLGIEPA